MDSLRDVQVQRGKCRHCFYPINQRNNELGLDEIERLIKTLPPIRLLLFSGGEPFLRKDLPEIIKLYYEHCGFLTASIPTNGFSAEHICSMIERICAISPTCTSASPFPWTA